MKKKGRICGTIGLILSLALAGGTVIYSTMFDKNAVGKAEKPFGAATTGSVFNRKGFDETKKLVDETEGVFEGTNKDAKYKSYTLSFNASYSITYKTETGQEVSDVNTEGMIYTDADYSYIKISSKTLSGRTYSVTAAEYAFSKPKSDRYYVRSNTYTALSNPSDSVLGDKAKWTERAFEDDVIDGTELLLYGVYEAFGGMAEIFEFGASEDKILIGATGEYSFKGPAQAADKYEAECRFTVGCRPTVRYTTSVTDPKNVSSPISKMTQTIVFSYSNLNNTKVSLPDSLKKAMEAK